jgi:hypothetical protein
MSADEFEDVLDVARDYLQGSGGDAELLAKDFAEVIVQLADACVVGARCERHGSAVHGQEAEELRAGIEQILRNTDGVREDEAAFVLPELRKSLLFLLDHVDARDSLACHEAAGSSVVEDLVNEKASAATRAFFAERSPGDKIAWGAGRSGVIQTIEDDHVMVLDDGWPADPRARLSYKAPFVVRLWIKDMAAMRLVEGAVTCA